MGATATYELDTERDKDAQAIFERSQKIQEVGHSVMLFLIIWFCKKLNIYIYTHTRTHKQTHSHTHMHTKIPQQKQK